MAARPRPSHNACKPDVGRIRGRCRIAAEAAWRITMTRRLYCASLLLLQLLLVLDVAPRVGRSVAAVTDAASTQGGWLATLPLAGAGVTLLCCAVVLAAPSIALLRHRQRGPRRFDGIPRSAAGATIVGAVVYGTASLPWWLVRLLPVEARVDTLLACEPCITAGMALMIGGATCAELLRRGVRSSRSPPVAIRTTPGPTVRRLPPPLPTSMPLRSG
jgi:hypothetical protein